MTAAVGKLGAQVKLGKQEKKFRECCRVVIAVDRDTKL
jgi:hypothetical protein